MTESFRVEQIGDCKLYLGDCRDILPLLPNFDAVVTDPPYGISPTKSGTESRSRIKGAYRADFEDTPDYVIRVCGPAVAAALSKAKRGAVTCGRTNVWSYPRATDIGCFYQPAATGVSFWGRPTWQPVLWYGTAPHHGQQLTPLHRLVTEAAEDDGHPCQKPILAWQWVVARTSKLGECVVDPFMGSCTTGVACVKLGRKFIGIEIEPKYFEIACQRIREAYAQPDLFIAPPKYQQIDLIDQIDQMEAAAS